MATTKITDLTAYTDPVSTDVLPIVDVTSDVTKKVSIADLMENAGSGSAAAPGISFDGDPNTGIYRPGADQVAISTNGTGRLFVDASGNVGVGTASPSELLHLSGSNKSIRLSGSYAASQSNKIEVNNGQTGGTRYAAGIELASDSGGNYTAAFYASSATDTRNKLISGGGGSTIFYTNDTERMRLDSSGRLGLGTSSPDSTSKLTIYDSGTATQFNLLQITNRGTPLTGDVAGIGFAAGETTAYGVKGSIGFRRTDTYGRGALAFYTNNTAGTESVSAANERMCITSAGNVGIGTASPSSLLHCLNTTNGITALNVQNESTGTAARADIIATSDSSDIRLIAAGSGYTGVSGWADAGIISTSSNTSNGLILNATAGGIKFSYNTTERARIDSTGRLLVGTSTGRGVGTSFQATVQVETTSYIGYSVVNNTNDSGGSAIMLAKSRSASVGGSTVVQNNDNLGEILFAGADGTDVQTPAASILVRVDGTATTTAGSFVTGRRYKIATVGTTDFTLIGASANTVGVIFTATGAGTGTGTATSEPYANSMPGRLVFSTTADSASSPTERMRITSEGKFKFSDSGAYISAAGTSHEFRNGSSNNIIRFSNTNATPYGNIIEYENAAPNSTGQEFLVCQDTGASRFRFRSNGGLANFQSNDANLCDEREKKNIETLDSTWSCLKNWDLKKFHYNEDADTDDKRYGVIAQQVAEHCPEVITDWVKQEAKDAVLDEDGNVVTPAVEEIVRMGVKEQQMMWMAIKALQEAQTRIETLEAEVAALKGV